MGMSAGGGEGGLKNDINVTPLIDVVLVLLIISMVTLPPKLHNETVAIPPEVENPKNVLTKNQYELELIEGGGLNVKYGKEKSRITLGELKSKFGDGIIRRGLVFYDCADLVTWDECARAFDVIQKISNKETIKIQWRIPKDEVAATGG